MYYKYSSQEAFESLYNMFSQINKAIMKDIPLYYQKIDKDFLSHTSKSQNNITGNLLKNNLVENFLYNDFENSFLPINFDNINARSVFNSLLIQGVTKETQDKTPEEKVLYWSQIISYIYHCRENKKPIVIKTSTDINTLSTSIPIVNKIQKSFTILSNEELSQRDNLWHHETPLYLERQAKILKDGEENFLWEIDNSLIVNNWADPDYVLLKVVEKINNLSFIDKQLLNDTDFTEKIVLTILEKIRIHVYKNEDILTQIGINEQFYKNSIVPLFEQIDSFSNETLHKYTDTLYKVYQFNKKLGISNEKIKSYFKDYFSVLDKNSVVFTDDITNFIQFFDEKNIIKSHIIEKIKDIKSKSRVTNQKTILESVFEHFPHLEDKNLILQLLDTHPIKDIYFRSFSYGDALIKFTKKLNEQEMMEFINHSSQTKLFIEKYLLENYKFSFEVKENFINQVLNYNLKNNPDHSIDWICSLISMNKQYIQNNYERILDLNINFNYQTLDIKNKLLTCLYKDSNLLRKKISERTLQKDFKEHVLKNNLQIFIKDNKLDLTLLSHISWQELKSTFTYSYGNTLLSKITQLDIAQATEFTKKEPLNYIFLSTKCKLDIDLSKNFLYATITKNKHDLLSLFHHIPEALFQNAEISLICIDNYLNKNENIYLSKIPKKLWNNKDFILKVCHKMDKSTTSQNEQLISTLPDNIQLFFKKFELKTGNYESFISTYIEKKELNKEIAAQNQENIVDKKKILKI